MNEIFQATNCLNAVDIRKYLGRELDEKSLHRVENHLLECPLCNDAVEGLAEHQDFESDPIFQELKSQIEHKSIEPANKRKNGLRFIWATAAAIALMVTAIWLYSNANQPERLYQAYYETYKSPAVGTLRSAAKANALSLGIDHYEKKEYESAIGYLEQHMEASPKDLLGTFLLGISYLELGQPSKAADLLSTVRFNSDLYYEEATWYATLASIRAENYKSALELIEDLEKYPGKSKYADKINELKKKIAELSSQQ